MNIGEIMKVVEKLREPANWIMELRGGGNWKDGFGTQYDRTPFEVADFLEEFFLTKGAEGRKKSETAKALKEKGLTIRQIAKVMGIPGHSLVLYYLKKND